MKKIFKYLGVSFVMVFLCFIVLRCLIVEQVPTTSQAAVLNAHKAMLAKQSVKELYRSVLNAKTPQTIVVSQQQLVSINALAHRAFPALHSAVFLSNQSANLQLSYPILAKGLYINVAIELLPSPNALKLGALSLGKVSINGEYLKALVAWGLNGYFSDDFGSKVLSIVKSVDVSKQSIRIDVELPEGLTSNEDKVSKLVLLRDKYQFFGNVKLIQSYLLAIIDFAQDNHSKQLIDYLRFTLALAQTANDKKGQAVEHNYAALMALAIYLGDDKFALLVGEFNALSIQEQTKRLNNQNNLLLANRNDLQKHFIYSMALQLFSQQQISHALGEFKELLDANHGGSGFSFIDLAADRAGTRFARVATINNRSARALQNKINRTDFTIIPENIAFPEGLSHDEFTQHYGNVHSTKYEEMLAEIDHFLSGNSFYLLK